MRRLFVPFRVSLVVSSVALLALTACSADTAAEPDDVESSEDALSQIVTPRPDGQFDVACQSSNGVAWTRVVTAAERATGSLCSGIPYEAVPGWAPPSREGYQFVYDKPEIQVARFSVSTEATYRISIPIYREWQGASDHAEANKPAKLVIFVDGVCAGSADAASTSPVNADTGYVRIRLARGAHRIGIAQANDYWDPSRGLDRNLWVAPAKVVRTTGRPTAAPADACVIHGEYPAAAQPVATDRVQSVLAHNDSPLARDFTSALNKRTVKQRYDTSYAFAFFRMLVWGFNLEAPTHGPFGGETNHFNLTPITEVDKAYLDGVIAWWQPEIDELRARVNTQYEAGFITLDDKNRKIRVLDALQEIIDNSIKPLRTTFERYPEVAKVKLDLR